LNISCHLRHLVIIGRRQPRARYIVNIKSEPTSINLVKHELLLGGLPLLAFVGFMFLRSARPRLVSSDGEDADTITVGSMLFDVKNRKLLFNGNTIDLTRTESRVLHIFASSPNQMIERARLQKEIWEDEGIIVGRSLDMFISKPRKKLKADPDSQIIVVRGIGYKLCTLTQS